MNLGLHVNVIFCYSLLFIIHNAVRGFNMERGPYKTRVLKSEKCEKLSAPYEKVPSAFFSCDIHKNAKGFTSLSGNLTMVRVDQNRKISIKGYIMEDGMWRMISSVNSRGCRGFLTKFLHMALQISGEDTCKTKGSFQFQDIDFNKLQHKWRKEAEYGLNLYRIDITSPRGTIICWEYKVATEPVNK